MKPLLFFCCYFFVNNICYSQDIFELHCNISSAPGVDCKAFLSINENKSGFIRLQVPQQKGGGNTIIDMDLMPESREVFFYPPTNDTFLFFKAEVVKKIAGMQDYDFNYLDIWLKRSNKKNSKFLPCTDTIPISWQYNFGENKMYTPVFAYLQQPDSLGYKFNGVASVINKSHQLYAAYLTKKKLRSYFTNLELNATKKFTGAQLNEVRHLNRPTLYCITVTDVKDKTIYETCKQDSKNVNDFFGDVARFINLTFKPIKIEDQNYNIASVNTTLKNLHPKKNDIVVFAFSGHGFSYRNDEAHQFPQLALWEGDAETQAFLRAATTNIESIYNSIKAKGAGLNLVLADCCNTYVEMERYQDSIIISPMETFPRWNKKATVNLFENTRSSFLMAAAKKGQLAGATASDGGFFTDSFWKTLRNTLRNREESNPQWPDIIKTIGDRAAAKAPRFICEDKPCEQTMIHKVN
jgi:hypothetical protein